MRLIIILIACCLVILGNCTVITIKTATVKGKQGFIIDGIEKEFVPYVKKAQKLQKGPMFYWGGTVKKPKKKFQIYGIDNGWCRVRMEYTGGLGNEAYTNVPVSKVAEDLENGQMILRNEPVAGNVQPPVSYTGNDLMLLVTALLFFVLATFGFCCACAMGFGFGYFASATSIKYNRINGGDETECDNL